MTDLPMTYYDMAKKLSELSKMLDAIPLSVIKAADDTASDAMFHVESSIRSTMKKLAEFQNQFNAMDMEVFNRSEESWERIQEARNVFEYRLRRLEWPKVDIPYGVERLVDLAERFSHLNDRQWARVVELAKALGEKQT